MSRPSWRRTTTPNSPSWTGRSVVDEQQHSSDTWRAVAAAVDYLAATTRPALTVWDALEEAVRWWSNEWTSPGIDPSTAMPWNDPDPLRTSLDQLLTAVAAVHERDGHALPAVLDAALDSWLGVMADRYNDGKDFDVGWRPHDSATDIAAVMFVDHTRQHDQN